MVCCIEARSTGLAGGVRSGSAIDDNIGKLLDYLHEQGLKENTVVVYTADQGYFLGEHGFFDKRMFYEEALRMPFVIRYPQEIVAGTENTDIILNNDQLSYRDLVTTIIRY